MRRSTCIIVAVAALAAAPAFGHVSVPGLDVNGQCVGDQNSDSTVGINELILAVNNALDGCADRAVEIQFEGTFGNEVFACGTAYSGIGTANAQIVPADFRLYISNPRLVRVTGEEVPIQLDNDGVWQLHDNTHNVAMLDFEDGTGPCANGNAATNKVLKGTVPSGVYTGIKFDLGLPFDLDHGDVATAVSPLNFSAMFWSWRDGYKFFRFDTLDGDYTVHLGSTGCGGGSPSHPPTSCSAPNLGAVSIGDFNPEHSVIAVDLKALLADSPANAATCLSEPDNAACAPVLPKFGLTFPGGQPDATAQRLFHLLSDNTNMTHVEMFAASASDGGGALLPHAEFDTTVPIALFSSECLGGTGDECDGGTRLFTAVNPGISPLAESDPAEGAYALADNTTVSLQLTAIDDGLTIRYGDTTLAHAGDSVVLGTTPTFHADLQSQVALPGGMDPSGVFSASFKLTTTSSAYTASDVVTLKFKPLDTAQPQQ